MATKEEIKTLAIKAESKSEQDKTVKLRIYDLSLFIGQSYFNIDIAQLYLIFQPTCKTITTFSGLLDTISDWELKGLLNEKFTSPYIATVSVMDEKLVWIHNSRIRLESKGSCLKQEDKTPFIPNNVVNLFIVYEWDNGHEI